MTVGQLLAQDGGVCVSAIVREQCLGTLELDFEDVGERPAKNIAEPVRAYRVRETIPR